MSTRGHLSRQSVLMRLQPHLVLDPSRCICLFTKAKLSPCPPRPFETPLPPPNHLGREMKNALKVNCFSFRHTRPTTLLVVVVVVVPFVVTRLVLFLYHEEDERRSFFTNFTALRDSFEGFFCVKDKRGN